MSYYKLLYFTAGPRPIQGVNATVVSDTAVNVAWKPSDSTVDQYRITVTNSNGDSFAVNVSGIETSTTVNTLMERTNYTLTVTATRNGVESTPSSVVSFTTLPDGKLFEVA